MALKAVALFYRQYSWMIYGGFYLFSDPSHAKSLVTKQHCHASPFQLVSVASKNIEISTRGTNSTPLLAFRWDHLRPTSGIICARGSFAVGDHLLCCAYQPNSDRMPLKPPPPPPPPSFNLFLCSAFGYGNKLLCFFNDICKFKWTLYKRSSSTY